MATLTTNLRDFLINVMRSDIDMNHLFDEDFFFDYFTFDGMTYEAPTEEERVRVATVCQITDPERITDIWIQAVSDHYENSYKAAYYDEALAEIEKAVIHSFEHLTDFFEEELLESGFTLEAITPFKVQLDWKADQLSIEGDLTALEIILNEIMRGVGWAYYDSLEDFIECNGSDQTKRILDHLYHLESIESVYGTVYDFFQVRKLSELDRYRCFGDWDVTDAELKEAMND